MLSIESKKRYLKQYKNFIEYLPEDFLQNQYNTFIQTYSYECGLNKDISFGLYLQNSINTILCHQIRNGNIDLEIELLDKYMPVLELIIRKLRIYEDLDKEGLLIKSIETYDGTKLLSLHILSVVRNRNNLETKIIPNNEKDELIEQPIIEDFDSIIEKYIVQNKPINNKPSYLDMLFIKLEVSNLIDNEILKKYILLKFGHYNLYFSNEDIARILGIDISLVNQMHIKCLELLRQVMNRKIENIIEYYIKSSNDKQMKKQF